MGTEIGVWKGDFSARMLKIVRPSSLHLIDPWKYYPAFGQSWFGNESMSQDKMDAIYYSVEKRFAKQISAGVVKIHRLPSTEAISAFPDDYFDWAYIDGNHSYEMVRKDLATIYPKVKKGGIIAGDDYGVEGWWKNGVTQAVADFLKDEGVCRGVLHGKHNQFALLKKKTL